MGAAWTGLNHGDLSSLETDCERNPVSVPERS
jgi:hypothetical protein